MEKEKSTHLVVQSTPLRIAQDNLHSLPTGLLQKLSDARQGPARAGSADEQVELTVQLAPDLRAGRRVVGLVV